jgi:hypothetical protein
MSAHHNQKWFKRRASGNSLMEGRIGTWHVLKTRQTVFRRVHFSLHEWTLIPNAKSPIFTSHTEFSPTMKTLSLLLLVSAALFIGCSSDDSSATGPDQTLLAPTDLKAVRVGRTAVRLTWTDNNESEESFAIERRAGTGAFVQQLFAAENVATAIDSLNLTAGLTYSYRVRAIRYSERGEYSSLVSVTLSLPYP